MAKLPSLNTLIRKIESYIDLCRNTETKKPIFANIAGFCRFAGISVSDLLSLKKRSPEDFEVISAYFEDAALNSGVTASLIGMYLRQYGFWSADSDEEDILCDHDMVADGV